MENTKNALSQSEETLAIQNIDSMIQYHKKQWNEECFIAKQKEFKEKQLNVRNETAKALRSLYSWEGSYQLFVNLRNSDINDLCNYPKLQKRMKDLHIQELEIIKKIIKAPTQEEKYYIAHDLYKISQQIETLRTTESLKLEEEYNKLKEEERTLKNEYMQKSKDVEKKYLQYRKKQNEELEKIRIYQWRTQEELEEFIKQLK